MFTGLGTPGNSNKATVRKFIGGGTLDSGLYRTKGCKGHPPSRAQTNGYRWSGELRAFCWKSPRQC